MKLVRFVTYYLLGVISIICVSVFTQYISTIRIPESPGYFEQLYDFFVSLFWPESWIYIKDGSASGAR
ncbi:hypothetical protein QFZ31_000304 [Neobacillus niacini]|nr:hypothetical protein [Neobacillus niacini]